MSNYPIARFFHDHVLDEGGQPVTFEVAEDLYRILLTETSRIVRTYEVPGLKEFYFPMPWGRMVITCQS